MTASRPSFKNTIKQIYSFEVPCSSNWIYENKFNPNIYVDISKTIKIKQKAFKFYIKTKLNLFPSQDQKLELKH